MNTSNILLVGYNDFLRTKKQHRGYLSFLDRYSSRVICCLYDITLDKYFFVQLKITFALLFVVKRICKMRVTGIEL